MQNGHAGITPDISADAVAPPRLQLDFLDGLRGLAAMLVVCFHFIGLHKAETPKLLRPLFFWTQGGHIAVDIFIVISGYCLMLPVARSLSSHLRGGLPDYFKRRARRILPPYYAAFALSLLALAVLPQHGKTILEAANFSAAAGFSWGNVLSHIVLIHNLFPQWQSATNTALWSIGTEWQIYFVFPFVLLPVWRRYGNKAALLTGGVLGLPFPLLFPHATLINVGCPWYIGLFTMGMAGAALSFRPSPRTRAWQPYLPVILVALCALYIVCKITIPEPLVHGGSHNYRLQWVKDYAAGLTAMCLLLYCTGLVQSQEQSKQEQSKQAQAKRSSVLLRVLETPILVFLGTFSYSLYLVHGIILNLTEALFAAVHLSATLMFVARLCVGIPLSVLCAYGFFVLVERRFLSTPAAARVQTEQKSLAW